MRNWRMAVIVVTLMGAQVEQRAEQHSGLMNEYYPAVCRPESLITPKFELVIFPPGKQEVTIEVPVNLGAFAYAPNGTALYTQWKGPAGNCLYKVEFNPVRVTPAACPQGLMTVFSVAISAKEDKFLISGEVKRESGIRVALFEIRQSDGMMTQVVGAPSRDFIAWRRLRLSPSGRQAVAIRNDHLELIDIDTGTTRFVGNGFLKASWSPDGRWIAALNRHGKTVLMDASDFKAKRTLAESEVEWSPDSRYLLRVKGCFFPIASNGVGTVQALDVNTGESLTIESSKCKVGFTGVGWVSRSIMPQATASGRSDMARKIEP